VVGERQAWVHGLAFRPDGRSFLTASKTARHIDLATGRGLTETRLPGPGVWTAAVAFHPREPGFATAGYCPLAQRWSADPGAPLGDPLRHDERSWIQVVAYSPDGRNLLTGSGAYEKPHWGEVRLWDAATGGLRHVNRAHEREVIAAAFRPDGRVFATGSRD